MKAKEIAEKTGVKLSTIYYRLKQGMSAEEILADPHLTPMHAGEHDLTGSRFGRLVVLGMDTSSNRVRWRCRCDCSIERVIRTDMLLHGKTKSCGCLSREISSRLRIERAEDLTGKVFGFVVVIGISDEKMRGSRLWRCQCPCGKEFTTRAACLRAGLTSCGCRYVHLKKFIVRGRSMTMKEMADLAGLSVGAIKARLRSGWSIDKAVVTPIEQHGTTIEVFGERLRLTEFAKLIGIPPSTIRHRIKVLGMSIEKASALKGTRKK